MSKLPLLLSLVLAGLFGPTHAAPAWEIPLKSKETLKRMATHVVSGEVRRVWKSAEKKKHHDYKYAVAEIAVHEVEKGKGPKAGELVYARWFTRSWRGPGPGPAESSGHYGWTPRRGDRVRAYLARNAHDGFDPDNKDGGFNAIVPNGFVKLENKK